MKHSWKKDISFFRKKDCAKIHFSSFYPKNSIEFHESLDKRVRHTVFKKSLVFKRHDYY